MNSSSLLYLSVLDLNFQSWVTQIFHLLLMDTMSHTTLINSSLS